MTRLRMESQLAVPGDGYRSLGEELMRSMTDALALICQRNVGLQAWSRCRHCVTFSADLFAEVDRVGATSRYRKLLVVSAISASSAFQVLLCRSSSPNLKQPWMPEHDVERQAGRRSSPNEMRGRICCWALRSVNFGDRLGAMVAHLPLRNTNEP